MYLLLLPRLVNQNCTMQKQYSLSIIFYFVHSIFAASFMCRDRIKTTRRAQTNTEYMDIVLLWYRNILVRLFIIMYSARDIVHASR